MTAITKEEKWLLIPAIEPNRKMVVSSNSYHETYLKEWGCNEGAIYYFS
ncbi:putative conjugative transfer protein [Orientia chuto str. Dubai]|uniref:Putative conjugative transfer protein n=1 Tax=Orientia chuto str. Dubai TaxID=1359168 RepID=A0A0F3MIR1_9RICK|nr:putative conjugative transfer protein [Orientia chuto str. Dubai]